MSARIVSDRVTMASASRMTAVSIVPSGSVPVAVGDVLVDPRAPGLLEEAAHLVDDRCPVAVAESQRRLAVEEVGRGMEDGGSEALDELRCGLDRPGDDVGRTGAGREIGRTRRQYDRPSTTSWSGAPRTPAERGKPARVAICGSSPASSWQRPTSWDRTV